MKNTTEEEPLAGCVYALALLVISPVTAIWKGYVFSVLWRWFIVTTFNAPPIGIAASIGLIYVVGMLTFHYRNEAKDERSAGEKFFMVLVFSLLGPALSLGFGAIAKAWM